MGIKDTSIEIQYNEGYKTLPKRRMNRKAGENAAAAAGNLGVAAIPLGIEGAVGELGDGPETIASRFIDRASGRINRLGKIVKTRLTHSPERVRGIEKMNKKKSVEEQKDKTVIGITGKQVPAPRTNKQMYKLEKNRRKIGRAHV